MSVCLPVSPTHTNIIIPQVAKKQPHLLNFEWNGWSLLWIPAQGWSYV